MSLSGTFDVFSLPEVLRMLASGSKSGSLAIESGGRSAQVELFEGECCGAGDEGADEPLVANHTPAALHARLLGVAFETGREPDGGFRFAADEHPRPRPAATIPVEPVLEELEQLHQEWDEISKVLPSTAAIPVLAPSLDADEIILSRTEWALLARLDGTTTVRDLPARADVSLIEVCRALAGLVRQGAIDVAAAPLARPARPSATEVLAEVMLDVALPEPEPHVEPEPESEPLAEMEPHAEMEPEVEAQVEVAEPESESETEPERAAPAEGDRGAMLRLFSALRE